MALRQETLGEGRDVEALYDLAFAPGRQALSSYRLREGVAPVADLGLVIEDAPHGIAGAIRFWPVQVGIVEALLLGPVAVHPTHQGEGLGALLIGRGVERAREQGWSRILLVGDVPYYGRFGFRQLQGVEMPPPTNPARVLGLGDWAGVTGAVARAPLV